MKINSVNQINFGRAFTTKEKKEYKQLISDCKKELGIKDTTAIAFDFNIPSQKGLNTGIGTTWSESMKNIVPFLKDMTGITSIQLQPQGKISKDNTSPYSGTNFAYGHHIIDLEKLTQRKYCSILPKEMLKQIEDDYDKDKQTREYKTDYDYVLGTDTKQGIQDKALRVAYSNFKKGTSINKPKFMPMKKDFEKFKEENESWLKKEAEFALLSTHYGTSDFRQWDSFDIYLNSEQIKDSNAKKERINQLKEEHGDNYDYEAFVQFLADKQQKESHEYLKTQDVKLYGDCLIGFSPSEMWGNIDAFENGLYYGGPDPNAEHGIQTWGLPAIKHNELINETSKKKALLPAGKLLLEKYKNFFKKYDGVRVDAAWQFITPCLYKEEEGKIEQVNINNKDKNIFFDIIDMAKRVVPSSTDKNIMLELVGTSADESRKLTLNKYPHLYTTAYAEYDENPAAFVRKGYEPDKFYVGVGCHDNDSIINLSNDEYKRNLHTTGIQSNYPPITDYYDRNQEEIKQNPQKTFRDMKFAELFTAPNQFFTLPDMFGMSERINISGKCDKNNWTVRIPSDYEKFYFTQLSKGYGLNMPKAFELAMRMKGNKTPKTDKLIEKCQQANEILLSDGPMTEAEANKFFGEV